MQRNRKQRGRDMPMNNYRNHTNEELLRAVDEVAPGHGSLLHTLGDRLAQREDGLANLDDIGEIAEELEALHKDLEELLAPLIGGGQTDAKLERLQEFVNTYQRKAG